MLSIDTCVILAGGFGSRITEETTNKPKPMVLIGDLPIIHHIMNYYSFYGVNKDYNKAPGFNPAHWWFRIK